MSNEKRVYPRQAWILMPSFKPKEVTVVKQYYNKDWDKLESGKLVNVVDLHATKAAAITAGREAVIKTQADIAKRQINLDKKVVALNKAEETKE